MDAPNPTFSEDSSEVSSLKTSQLALNLFVGLPFHVSQAYSSTEQTLDLYIFSLVLVWRIVDFHMLVSLIKDCVGMQILVDISFSILLSAEMKLPRYLKAFTSISTFYLTVVFMYCAFSFMSLFFVGCFLRATISTALSTLSISVFLVVHWRLSASPSR